MGVKGLWRLLLPIGRRVSVEVLEGKVLAIDASIWLTQFLKAMRDPDTGSVKPAAHLIGFFRRLAKLRFHGIRPILVFDGATPIIKLRELNQRRRRREQFAPNTTGAVQRLAKRLLIQELKKGKQQKKLTLDSGSAPGFNLPEDGRDAASLKPGNDGETDVKEVVEISHSGDTSEDVARDLQEKEWQATNEHNAQEVADTVLMESSEEIARALQEEEWKQSAVEGDGEHETNDWDRPLSASESIESNQKKFEEKKNLREQDSSGFQHLLSLPVHARKDAIEAAKRQQRMRSRREFMPVAGQPEEYSQVQVRNFLRSTRLNQNISKMAQKAAETTNMKGESIASDPTRRIIFEKFDQKAKKPHHKKSIMQQDKSEESDSEIEWEDAAGDKGFPAQSSASTAKRPIKRQTIVLDSSDEEDKYNAERSTRKVTIFLDSDDESVALTGSKYTPNTATAAQSDTLAKSKARSTLRLCDDSSTDSGSEHNATDSLPDDTTNEGGFFKVQQHESAGDADKEPAETDDNMDEGGFFKVLHPKTAVEPIQELLKQPDPIDVNSQETESGESTMGEGGFCRAPSPKMAAEPVQELFELQKSVGATGPEKKGTIGAQIAGSYDQKTAGTSEEKCLDNDDGGSMGDSDDSIDWVDGEDEELEKPIENVEYQSDIDEGSVCNDDHPTSEVTDTYTRNTAALEAAEKTAANLTNWAGRAFRRAISQHKQESSAHHLHISPSSKTSAALKLAPEKVTTDVDVREKNYRESRGTVSQATSPIKKPGPTHNDISAEDVDSGHDSLLDLKMVGRSPNERNEAPSTETRKVSVTSQPVTDAMELMAQEEKLDNDRRRNERDMEGINDEMKAEIISLIELFGIPYVDSPAEAEAQCAALEELGLVDGIVTEDSDVFVFGGKTIYRNMFDDQKFVEVYRAEDAEREMLLGRDEMVALAMLLGGDYTEGVRGVGIVNAMEILRAFPMTPTVREGLENYRQWLDGFDPSDAKGSNSAEAEGLTGLQKFHASHRSARSRWVCPKHFPAENVLNAYLNPVVDKSSDAFSWGIPDVDNLVRFCAKNMGWEAADARRMLDPVMTKLQDGMKQTRLDLFMNYSDNIQFANVRSKRLRSVFGDIQREETQEADGSSTSNTKKKPRTKS